LCFRIASISACGIGLAAFADEISAKELGQMQKAMEAFRFAAL
jgi:hypothetical protein